jgi:hypothetical protein
MIEEIGFLIDDFPGPANQTRCFLHIINLVVKSILRQFDLPTSRKASDNDEDAENDIRTAKKELLKLASEIEHEEQITAGEGDNDTTDDDNDDGWVDERDEMTEEEVIELAESVQPVRLLLSKVC